MIGQTLSCLLAFLLMIPALPAQNSALPGVPASERVSLHGVPARNVLTQPLQPIPGPWRLRQLAQRAGTIFSGTVTAVEPSPPSLSGELASVAITFHVEQGIRNAVPGQNFTIHEWRGLWTDAPRYRPGQRLLLFLFPPSNLGLTSTVSGPLGRFKVDAAGHILLNAQQQAFLANEPELKAGARLRFVDFARAVLHSLGEDRP